MKSLTNSSTLKRIKMSKEQTNPEITKKIEENTEKLIKEIVAEQKKALDAIKKETATKIENMKKKIIENAKSKADSEFTKEKAKHEIELKLKISKYRDDLVDRFIEKASEKMKTVVGTEEYEKSLEKLVLEAAFTLKQSEIILQCREEDKKILTNQFFDKISKQLQEQKINTKINLSNKYIKSMGGIKVEIVDGKISINNTYEKRIERSLENLKKELSLLLTKEG